MKLNFFMLSNKNSSNFTGFQQCLFKLYSFCIIIIRHDSKEFLVFRYQSNILNYIIQQTLLNQMAFKLISSAIPDLQLSRSFDNPEQVLQDCLLRNFKLIRFYSVPMGSVQQIKISQFRKKIIPKNIEQLNRSIKCRQLKISKEKRFRISKEKYKINSNIFTAKQTDYHKKQFSDLENNNSYSCFTKDNISHCLTNDSDKQNIQKNQDQNENFNKLNFQKIDFKQSNQKSKTQTIVKLSPQSQNKKINHFDIIKEGNDWVLASINNYNDTFLVTRKKKRQNLLSCSEMRQKMMRTTRNKNYLSLAKKFKMSDQGKKQQNSKRNYLIKQLFPISITQSQHVFISMPLNLKSHRKEHSMQFYDSFNKQNDQDLIKMNYTQQLCEKQFQSSFQSKQTSNNLLTFRKRKQLRNLTQRLVSSFPSVK